MCGSPRPPTVVSSPDGTTSDPWHDTKGARYAPAAHDATAPDMSTVNAAPVEGNSLLEDEPDSHAFDYAKLNSPFFFGNDTRVDWPSSPW
jgi:hypothetical protein